MSLATLCVAVVAVCFSEARLIRPYARQNPQQVNHTFFPGLLNRVRGARAAPAERYPWLGKLTPARRSRCPALCSLVAVRDHLFVTVARCVVSLRPEIVHVYYGARPLPVLGFVVSDDGDMSNQLFDDTAFVVTRKTRDNITWHPARLLRSARTDQDYRWFGALANEEGVMRHRIVAFSEDESNNETIYELDVYMGIEFCHRLYSLNYTYEGYRFPCAGPCLYQDYIANKKQCYNYISVGGAPVVDTRTKQVVAFSSWGDSADSPWHLPIGVTFPNTHKYNMNYKCAKEIARRQSIDTEILEYCN